MNEHVHMEEIGEKSLLDVIDQKANIETNFKKDKSSITVLNSISSNDKLNQVIYNIFKELGVEDVKGENNLYNLFQKSLSKICELKSQNEKLRTFNFENKDKISPLEMKLNNSEEDLRIFSKQLKSVNNKGNYNQNEKEENLISVAENSFFKNQNNENTKLKLINNELNIKIEELQIMIQEKEDEINLNKTNNDIEVKNLNSLINGLRDLISHQSEEIFNENKNKMQLSMLVYKLMNSIQKFETIFSNMEKIDITKENEYNLKLKLISNENNTYKEQQKIILDNKKQFFEELSELVKNELNNEMIISLIDENNLMCIIDIINEIIHQSSAKNNEEINNSILEYIMSENQKLYKLLNIHVDDNNIINQMMDTNQLLNNFINENISLFKKSMNYNNNNEIQDNQFFSCHILSFLKTFTCPSNDESRLLFEVIKGLITLIKVLLFIGETINARNKSKEQEQIKELSKEHLENEKLKKDIEKLQSKILILQKMVSKLKSFFIKYKDIFQKTKSQKLEGNQEQIKLLTKENRKYISKIKNLTNCITELKESLESKSEENNALHDKITNLQFNSLQQENTIKLLQINLHESKNIIQEKESSIKELKNQFLSYIQEAEKKKLQKNQLFKKEYQQILKKTNIKLDEKNHQIESMKTQYESINQFLKNKLTESRDSSLQIQKDLIQKTNECKELQTKLSSMKFENSMLSLEIEQTNQKIAKTQSYLEQRNQMLNLSYSNQMESKIKEIQNEFIQEKNDLIQKIIDLFSLTSEDIHYDNIEDTFKRIKIKLSEYESNIKLLRGITGTNLDNLPKYINQIINKLKKIQKENEEIKALLINENNII